MAIEVARRQNEAQARTRSRLVPHIECPLPAVLSIQSGINKVRYATLKGIMAAKKKEIVTITRESLGIQHEPNAKNRKNLCPHENQKNRIPNWHSKRSRHQTSRKTQVSKRGSSFSARKIKKKIEKKKKNNENPRHHRTPPRQVEQRQLRNCSRSPANRRGHLKHDQRPG